MEALDYIASKLSYWSDCIEWRKVRCDCGAKTSSPYSYECKTCQKKASEIWNIETIQAKQRQMNKRHNEVIDQVDAYNEQSRNDKEIKR